MNPKATKNLKSWKPGQSGNPAGKPKGARNRSSIVRDWLEAKATDGSGQVADQLVAALVQKALKGDVAAFRELFDSGYGKVRDQSETAITYNALPAIKINGKLLELNVGKPVKRPGT